MRHSLWFAIAALVSALGSVTLAQPAQDIGEAPASDAHPASALPAASEDGIAVYFSPHGGAAAAVIGQIEKAKSTIRIQAYYFTSAPIAKALLDAKKRGVQITVILDPSQRSQRYSSITFFHNQGIPVFVNARFGIYHNKIMLIDERTIITGSFNFTRAADESNAENLLIIEAKPQLTAAYLKRFQEHLAESEPYRPQNDVAEQGKPDTTTSGRQTTSKDQQDPKQITVFVTRTGSKYHRDGCSFLSKSKIPMSLEEAKQRYSPCSRCNPPQ